MKFLSLTILLFGLNVNADMNTDVSIIHIPYNTELKFLNDIELYAKHESQLISNTRDSNFDLKCSLNFEESNTNRFIKENTIFYVKHAESEYSEYYKIKIIIHLENKIKTKNIKLACVSKRNWNDENTIENFVNILSDNIDVKFPKSVSF